MNILFLDQFSDPGGAQQCLLDLWPAIHARGWRAVYGLPGEGWLVERLRERGAEVTPISCGMYSSGQKSLRDAWRFTTGFPRLVGEIGRLAEHSRADLIYVNGPRVLPAAAKAARGRWPLIFHCHSRITQRYAASLCGRAIHSTNAEVIACCRYVAEPLVAGNDRGRLHVVYNGVAEGAARRNQPPPWRIGVIGRIAPENGQAEFLQAARMLTNRRSGVRFVVCGAPLFGSRQARQYAERLQTLAVGLPVEFLGWRADVANVLADLDILVAPLVGEVGPARVILEAYASQVPVVAFPAGAVPEIVADGKTGFLVEPRTPEALARRLEALLQQPERLRQATSQGFAAWKERFTVERYQREILAVLETSGELKPAVPRPARPPAA